MSELTHDQARQYIEAAAENRLGSHERSELDRHLSACQDCRQFASELGELGHSLASAFHARWDPVPFPAPQPRRIQTGVQRARTRRILWTAGQLVAGAAALFLLIFAIDNLVGPNRSHLPTSQGNIYGTSPAATPQANLSYLTGTPQATRAAADLYQPTKEAMTTAALPVNTLNNQPPAIFYADGSEMYRKQYGLDPELILDLTGHQPDEGKVLAAWTLADQIVLLREPGLQRVHLPSGAHEWIYRLDKAAYYGTLQPASNGTDLIYTASIQDPGAPFAFATRIGIYHIPEGLIQPVLSIQQTVIPLAFSSDQKSLYVQPVGQDPTFKQIWRVNVADGRKVDEISLDGFGYGLPAVSPDGTWLVAAQQKSSGPGQTNAHFLGSYSLEKKQTRATQIEFNQPSHAADLTWSADSQQIFFVLNPGDSMVDRSASETNLWSASSNQWTTKPVDRLPIGEMHLISVSPDGDWIFLKGENEPHAAFVDIRQGLHGIFQIPANAIFAGWETFTLAIPPAAATPTPTPLPRPSIHGKVVNGYGDHAPAANIPLAIDQTGISFTPIATTDAQGNFSLSSLPLGKHNLQSTWFSVPFIISSPDQDIDLGVIKYPLVHPPLFLSQKASTDPGLTTLKTQGTMLPFQVVFADPAWKRPSENEQRDQVWSNPPFANHGQIFFDWWFKQPAFLYDTLDLFTSGTPGGPDLSATGADWRLLAGLWNTTDFLADPDKYSPTTLNDILQRKQLDIWLLGYQVDEVRQLGDHYLVAVHPAPGLQVIRFQGNEAALAIHVVDGDQEIIRLPRSCRNERDVDCGSEGS